MKRNHPLFTQSEHDTILERRTLLYKQQADIPLLKTSLPNNGFWIPETKLVELNASCKKALVNQYVRFNKSTQTRYMNPFEALYHVELGKLCIFHCGFPLSVAESFSLLLENKYQFDKYLVFQQLNRQGYFVFPSEQNCNIQTTHVDFDIYSRSTYTKGKKPKFRVVVKSVKKSSLESMEIFDKNCCQLMFAIVDDENNIAYYSLNSPVRLEMQDNIEQRL